MVSVMHVLLVTSLVSMTMWLLMQKRSFQPLYMIIIDTEHGILTLDPSLDTLGAYSASKQKGAIASFDCSRGKIIKELDVQKSAVENFDYYLSSASILQSEDVFESAVGLWERLCPELLILDVAVPNGAENEARVFSERIEELYRAALYGSLAISLSGFDCESELTDALRLLHKAFCILEAEGREFNSYLPRGITVSSPIWLTRPSPVTNPDFLLFDIDTLLPSLFSLTPDEIIKKEKALKKELLSAFERYFLNFAPYCEIFIKSERFFNTSFMRELVRFTNAKAVFSG